MRTENVLSQSEEVKRMVAVEEKLEERTNRQLRKTLVFRGIKQEAAERSWKDCEEVLAKEIASTLEIDCKDARNMIDRCHRGGNPEYFKKQNTRHGPFTQPYMSGRFARTLSTKLDGKGPYLLIINMVL